MTNYVVSTAVNGTFEVPDDLINTAQLAINLIGRGVTNYGQAVAQNDINLLQNFAGPTPPTQPIIGQLWFNSTTLYLQVYTSAGTWSPVSFESDLSNYATVGELASTNSALSALATSSATKLQLNNYVTIAGLYTPPVNATPVPIAAGGTGITNIGTAGQVLTVNSFGTGLIYASPYTSYQYGSTFINTSTTLTGTSLGTVCNIITTGITVTLPQSARSPSGEFLIFTFLLAGTATIVCQNGDDILAGAGIAGQTYGTSYTIYAGEQVTFVSNGVNQWMTINQSRTVTPTPTAGDNSLKLANTAYVQNSLSPYLLSTTAASVYAPLVSPAFSGTPTAPTPAVGDASSKAATTAFVTTAVTNGVNSVRLGYTPVQQGGGTGQAANKVYIGWNGSGLAATVDATNLGTFVFEAELDANVNSLNSQIGTINSEIGTINSEIGTINSNIGSLNTAVASKQPANNYPIVGTGNAVQVNWASPALNLYVDSSYQGQIYTSGWYQPMTLAGVGSYTIWSHSLSRGQVVAIPGVAGTWMAMSVNATGTDGIDWLLCRIS